MEIINIYRTDKKIKRGMSVMSNEKNQENNSETQNVSDKIKFNATWISLILNLSTIIITIFGIIFNYIIIFHDMKRDIITINKTIEKSELITLSKDDIYNHIIAKMLENKLIAKSNKQNSQANKDNIKNDNAIKCISLVYKMPTTSPDTSPLLSTPNWNGNKKIAKSYNEDKYYTLKELSGKKILMSYDDDGQTAFFYGQLNKKGCWDGDCILNVYKRNTLKMITEATYSNGKLKNYQQVFMDKNSKSDKLWYVSNRRNKGKYNTGKTWSYYRGKNIVKKFNEKNAKARDILSVSQFKQKYAKKQEGFYCGRTSNGKYNDSTGKAYYFKYNKDGNIRILYQGKFKNGSPNDVSGKAWHVVLGDDGLYYYHVGVFIDGYIDKKTISNNDKNKPLNNKELDSFVKKLNITEKIKWKQWF